MLAQRLKQKRKEKGFSQAELARRVGIGRDSFNKYERAGVQPSNDTLVKLATLLDTTVDYLLGKSDSPQPTLLDIPETLQGSKAGFHRSEFEELTQDEVDKLALIADWLKSARKNADSGI